MSELHQLSVTGLSFDEFVKAYGCGKKPIIVRNRTRPNKRADPDYAYGKWEIGPLNAGCGYPGAKAGELMIGFEFGDALRVPGLGFLAKGYYTLVSGQEEVTELLSLEGDR